MSAPIIDLTPAGHQPASGDALTNWHNDARRAAVGTLWERAGDRA